MERQMADDWGKMREELVGKGTDYKTTKKIVEGSIPKTVGNNPMETMGSGKPHSFHKTKHRAGHRIGKR
jgi:hypothetical protein